MLATRNLTQTTNLGSTPSTTRSASRASTPKTKYLYRLGDGTNWTEWFEFETASADAEPFSFVYFGDAQNDIQEHWSRVVAPGVQGRARHEAVRSRGRPVDTSTSDCQWGEWFNAGALGQRHGAVLRHHRQPRVQRLDALAAVEHEFAWPENGPQGTRSRSIDALKGTAFYTDFQGVRFISLNSNVAAVPRRFAHSSSTSSAPGSRAAQEQPEQVDAS